MKYYITCPDCGCNLDPGEICDCTKETAVSTHNTDSGKGWISERRSTPTITFLEGNINDKIRVSILNAAG